MSTNHGFSSTPGLPSLAVDNDSKPLALKSMHLQSWNGLPNSSNDTAV